MRSACEKSKRPSRTGSDGSSEARRSRPRAIPVTRCNAAPMRSSAALIAMLKGIAPALSCERSSRSATKRFSRSTSSAIVTAALVPFRADVLGERADGRQRRADVVRDRREQRVLELVRLLERLGAFGLALNRITSAAWRRARSASVCAR
jgi:hypothetical protein